jgi:hypothetical protein
MHVVVGTETYGRVKSVEETAIVTQFAMLQMLPAVPIKSYYVWGPAESESTGVPFLASVVKMRLRGVPLARIDWLSVTMTYIRAVLAPLALFGVMGTVVSLVSSANGQPMDHFALTATRLAWISLAAGIVGGGLTYLMPTVSRRERAIRMYCGEILGVCIDPRRVTPDIADALRDIVTQPARRKEKGASPSRWKCLRELVLLRCDAATTADRNFESRTDDLLEQLRNLDQ